MRDAALRRDLLPADPHVGRPLKLSTHQVGAIEGRWS
jgi:hypothetical protein